MQGSQVARRTNQMAMVSLIAGIVGWVLWHPFVASLVAVYCGHKAKRELRETNYAEEGDGYATVGLVLGYVHLATTIIGCIVAAFFFSAIMAMLGLGAAAGAANGAH